MSGLPSPPPNMFATSSFTPPSAHYYQPTIPAPQQDDDNDEDENEDENEDDNDNPPPSHDKRQKRQIRRSHCGTSSHK